MERLTKRFDGWVMREGCHGPCRTCNGAKCADIFPMIDRLAAYEDTGLEPEEMSEYQHLCDSYAETGLDSKFVQFCIDATQNGLSMNRIRELAQAEKDGRLVVLPPNDPLPWTSRGRPIRGCGSSSSSGARNRKEPDMTDELNRARGKLQSSFPGSFINTRGEFIAHLPTNQYIILEDCKSEVDIKAKVLEWFSRPAHKTNPYYQEWRNRKFHVFMLRGVNDFLGTDFTEKDVAVIYQRLGNRVNHSLTMQFIAQGMDVDWLEGA